MRKRVLITGPALSDPGGVANYYNAVLPALYGLSNFDIEYIEIGSTAGGGKILHFFNDQLKLRRALKRQPDLLHVNPSLDIKSFIRDGLFIWQARRRHIPVLVFFRGWEKSVEKKIKGLLKVFFNLTYGKANHFLVLASEFKDALLKWGVSVPIDLTTTTVNEGLLLGFDFNEKDAGISAPVKVLFMARLEPEKGAVSLLESVIKLLDEGHAFELTIAGDGPSMDQLKTALSGRPDLQGQISIAGYVRGNQKSELLKTHNVFCFPSEYGEGMPNSIMEAFAFGLAIVTCPVGGIKDFFVDGKMGSLIPGRAAEHIEAGLKCMLENPEWRSEVCRYNYNYAQNNFLSGDVARSLAIKYGELLVVDEPCL